LVTKAWSELVEGLEALEAEFAGAAVSRVAALSVLQPTHIKPNTARAKKLYLIKGNSFSGIR